MNHDEVTAVRVPDDMVYIIETTFDRYKTNPVNMIPDAAKQTATKKGVQTHNLLNLKDFINDGPFYRTMQRLTLITEREIDVKLQMHHIHLIEYDTGGYQTEHDHSHNEDWSIVLYLNTCNDGDTYFPSLGINHFPVKNKMVIFSAYAKHGANETNSGKKILVMGFKVEE